MIKRPLCFALLAFVSNLSFAQDCSTDPGPYTDYVVSGNFTQNGNQDYLTDDVVMLNQIGNYLSIDVLVSQGNGVRTLKKGTNSAYYDLSNVDGRMVKGDFDNDGHIDDFILMYKTGAFSFRFDLFASNGAASPAFTQTTMTSMTGYDADKVTGRFVSGDFDNDGNWDDIAAFYDYGGGQTRIHVWTSNGYSMSYAGSNGWWNTMGYTATQVTDRVVSGDFDRDGKVDDIAAFYDYGGGQTRIHVWLSNGSSLNYQGGTGWWSSTGYTAGQITNRVVSLNIDRDSKEYDDIAVFYDYGNGQTRMHVFESTGSSFGYSTWWTTTGYTAGMISGKIVAYDTHSSFSKKDGDIIAFYDYGANTTKYHMWEAKKPLFGSPYTVYGHKNFCNTKREAAPNALAVEEGISVNAYPNPVKSTFTIEVSDELLQEVPEASVFNSLGQLIVSQSLNETNTIIDLSEELPGIYIVKIVGTTSSQTLKLIKE